ncbi:MAG: ADP-glyceromanno-heptose 6-epimerase [Bacteroidota bacterium]
MLVLTGGAGFIGSCFLKKLNDEGFKDILIVDHLGTDDKWRNLLGKSFADITDIHTFRRNLLDGAYGERIESIVHLGACSTTTERDADYLLDNNYAYSRDLAEYAVERNIRFIYASSAATYGLGENGYNDTEFENLRPLNMYGFSKHIFDLWVLKNGFEKKTCGIKFFNVFGPNEYSKGDMASMVFKAFRQIKQTGGVKLFKSNSPEYKDGDQKRDFIYVKDACDVMWTMLQENSINGIYNLGTGKARSWNDLASAVFKAMDVAPKIEYIEMPESLKSQYQNFTEANMTSLEKTSAFKKFMSLEESVEDYVQNYLIKNFATM